MTIQTRLFMTFFLISAFSSASDFKSGLSAFKSPLHLQGNNIKDIVSYANHICQIEDSCRSMLHELTEFCYTLPNTKRLALLDSFLNHTLWEIEIVMDVINQTRSGFIDVREETHITDCLVMIDLAKDGTISSSEELKRGRPNRKSYSNIHTWISGALTSYGTCKDNVIGASQRRIEPQIDSMVSLARLSLAIFVSISPLKDIETKIVVPEDFPSWFSKTDQKFLNHKNLKVKANIVVAKDGTGNYKTVTEAIAAAPENSKKRYIIYVKRGVYNETIYIGKMKKNLTLIGDGKDATILTGNLSNKTGYSTTKTATVGIDAKGFMAKDLCFQNTAGPENAQAVALRINADFAVIYRCSIVAFQDTLYAQSGRQFYRECYITGTVDFIFGNAAAVFQYCNIEARKPMSKQNNMVTAQGRSDLNYNSGFSIQKCRITASMDLAPIKNSVKTFLGRPWKMYSTVVVMESFISDVIDPKGWAPWNGSIGLSTLYYGEYKNNGPGSNTSKRVHWKGYKVIIDPREAANFTVVNLILGDLWLNSTGVPYQAGL